jgi:hypothetical protein
LIVLFVLCLDVVGAACEWWRIPHKSSRTQQSRKVQTVIFLTPIISEVVHQEVSKDKGGSVGMLEASVLAPKFVSPKGATIMMRMKQPDC